ncbi:energy transducer TonB [Sphingomonas soli]|uniref:energy transducer TonB n=1 Tax=Sphingomonas soli TaxID=266127 RepID=UPI000831CDA3|nr:energy transducer TonB [Sphingomonas soli]
MIRIALFVLALAGASPAAGQSIVWPRDPGSGQPAMVQPVPRQPLTALITPDDYPDAAFRANEEGDVGIRLLVSAKGKASDCTVLRSSGSRILDAWTCGLLTRRTRFTPALDAEGKPTHAVFDYIVAWKITDEVRRARQ